MRGRIASDCSGPASTKLARNVRAELNQHVAAADECRCARLFEHHFGDTEQDGHHADADAESRREHGASHRMGDERSDGQSPDHCITSSSMRPSLIVRTRVARSARAASCVTMTSAVPSALTRSSRVATCSPVV